MHIAKSPAGLLVALCTLLLAGCATPNYPAPVAPGYAERPPSPELTLTDDRPKDEIVTDTGSVWITSCDFGLMRLGDDITVPPKLGLLRRDLEDALGPRLRHATLAVHHYKLFLNAVVAAQAFATNGGLGEKIVGSIMEPGQCPDGFYTASEVANKFPPFIVEIAVTLNGRDYKARIVSSPPLQLSMGIPGPALQAVHTPDGAAALFAALNKANAELIRQIALDLPKT